MTTETYSEPSRPKRKSRRAAFVEGRAAGLEGLGECPYAADTPEGESWCKGRTAGADGRTRAEERARELLRKDGGTSQRISFRWSLRDDGFSHAEIACAWRHYQALANEARVAEARVHEAEVQRLYGEVVGLWDAWCSRRGHPTVPAWTTFRAWVEYLADAGCTADEIEDGISLLWLDGLHGHDVKVEWTKDTLRGMRRLYGSDGRSGPARGLTTARAQQVFGAVRRCFLEGADQRAKWPRCGPRVRPRPLANAAGPLPWPTPPRILH